MDKPMRGSRFAATRARDKGHTHESASLLHSQTHPIIVGIGKWKSMCAHLPSKNRRDLTAGVPQPEYDMPARRQSLTVDDLRRLADACRDLDDPVGMVK